MINNSEQSQTLCPCAPVAARVSLWGQSLVEMLSAEQGCETRPCRLRFRLPAPAPLGCLMPWLACPPATFPAAVTAPALPAQGHWEAVKPFKGEMAPSSHTALRLCYLGNDSLAGWISTQG